MALSADLEQLRLSVSSESEEQLQILRQDRQLACQQLEEAEHTVLTQKQQLTELQEERGQLLKELDELSKVCYVLSFLHVK